MDAKSFSSETRQNADVCIIGAGVAGITLALELDKKGISSILLDGGDESFSMESQSLYSPGDKIEGYEDITYNRLRFLGGSSNHWQNSTGLFTKEDFEKRDWIPNSGWPITHEDIAPHYVLAGHYCGTGTDGYDTQYWLNKMGGVDPTKGSNALELGINKAAIPPTRFYYVHGAKIVDSEHINLIKNANLVDLEFDENTQLVNEITFVTYNSQSRHKVTAKQFILCCGGIENARFMLLFNEKYQNKIGNQYDNIGRYFMEHPVLRAANFYPSKNTKLDILNEGILEEGRMIKGFMQIDGETLTRNKAINLRLPLHRKTKYEISEGIRSYHYLTDSSKADGFPNDGWSHIYNIIADLDMFAEAIARKKFSTELFEHAKEFGGYEISMMFEQIPDRNNRITLSEDRDVLGIKKVNVQWQLLKKDKENVWTALELIAKELGKSNLGKLHILDEYEEQVFGNKMFFSHHHMGTTRMADSPNNGVVDKNLKVFGTQNLFIGGSSIFSTSSHVPPTLTISAFSVRLAEHLAQIKGLVND